MSYDYKVYLSGEIHSDWRETLKSLVNEQKLPISFLEPVTDHSASDNCGVDILGSEEKDFWKDHKGAKINAIRTRTGIERADIVVVKFGNKYRQWNAAFDTGYAAALGKKLIVVHPEEHTHALKEVDSAALAVCSEIEQVAEVLAYIS